MKAGNLRHRVRIESPGIAKDDFGQTVSTWELVAERRCEITGFSGGEEYSSSAEIAESTHKILMRYDSISATITSKYRFVYSSLIFEITAPPENVGMKNKEIKFICKVVE